MNKIRIALIKSHEPDTDPRLIKEIKAIENSKNEALMIYWNRNPSMKESRFKSLKNYEEKKFSISINESFFSILFWPLWWVYIFFSLLVEQMDIIHALNFNSIFPALLAGKIKRKPVIYEIMDTSYESRILNPLFRKIIVFFDKFFMKMSNAIILVDENQIKQFNGIPNQNIFVIYDSAFDLLKDKRLNQQSNTSFNIAYVGTLFRSRKLNLDKLFEAVNQMENVHLTIAGYGDMENEIRAWALKSKGKIEFKGRVTYDQSLELCMEADALVVLRDSRLNSNKYICGSKIWESMMCGKPIIVNQGTSTSEKVKKENCGIVLDATSSRKILEGILKLVENPYLSEKYGANGRKAYENKYNWNLMENKLIELYEKLN